MVLGLQTFLQEVQHYIAVGVHSCRKFNTALEFGLLQESVSRKSYSTNIPCCSAVRD
jgi:hypothetical protein